jgi:hypothetical protein
VPSLREGNLISAGRFLVSGIYLHDGFTTTIQDSFQGAVLGLYDVSWYGTGVCTCIRGAANEWIRVYDGFSNSLLVTYNTPDNQPWGITNHSVRTGSIWNTDQTPIGKGKVYLVLLTTVLSSYIAPDVAPTGVTWNNVDVMTCDSVTDTIYRHDGTSATVAESFASPAANPYGMSWDGLNLLSTDNAMKKVYKHDKFSSTILTTLGPFLVKVWGCSWDARYTAPRRRRKMAAIIRSRRNRAN